MDPVHQELALEGIIEKMNLNNNWKKITAEWQNRFKTTYEANVELSTNGSRFVFVSDNKRIRRSVSISIAATQEVGHIIHYGSVPLSDDQQHCWQDDTEGKAYGDLHYCEYFLAQWFVEREKISEIKRFGPPPDNFAPLLL